MYNMSIGKIFGLGSKGLRIDSQNCNSVPFGKSLVEIYSKYSIPKPVENPPKADNSNDAPTVKYGIPKPPEKDEFVTNDKVPQNQETVSNQGGIKYAIPNKNFV